MSNRYAPIPENMQQNQDGTWSATVPLPFYGLKKKCECGKSFWKEENYWKHYIDKHTDGLKYIRDKTSFHAVERIYD